MPDIKATVISPDIFAPVGDMNPYAVEKFEQRYLAQGDSWFSLGALLPAFTTNLPEELVLSRSTLIVNCARPGKVLALMTDTTQDPKFVNLLSRPNTRRPWDGLLLSGQRAACPVADGGDALAHQVEVGLGAVVASQRGETVGELQAVELARLALAARLDGEES